MISPIDFFSFNLYYTDKILDINLQLTVHLCSLLYCKGFYKSSTSSIWNELKV